MQAVAVESLMSFTLGRDLVEIRENSCKASFFRFGAWDLGFVWDLDFETWDLLAELPFHVTLQPCNDVTRSGESALHFLFHFHCHSYSISAANGYG